MTTGAGIASPTPILQFFNNAGQPNAGGTILTQVGGVNQATYQDSGLAIPLPNPIPLNSRGEVSNASGTSCQLFLPPNTVYTFTMYDANGNQINQASYVTSVAPTAQSIGQLIWPQTAQELAASVTPTYYNFPPGDWRRYGADPTGVADSTAAINAANSANSESFDAIGGTYICSAALALYSNLTMHGVGSGTVLQFASGAIDNIFGYNIGSVIVRDMKIVVTGTAGGNETGGVHIRDCNYITVQNVEMVGMNWSGVFIDTCGYCLVEGCYFHGFTDTAGTGGDIIIYGISGSGGGTIGSNFNIFANNQCFGGGGYGIMIEDPYQAVLNGLPSFNIISGNRIGAHLTYGIATYLPSSISTAQNTYNQIVNNFIENISGTCPTNPNSGMGIYCVGLGIGGVQILGNTVLNCCTLTGSGRTLPAAGIAISGLHSGLTPAVIDGNIVASMPQGDGICVTGSLGGAVIAGNSVTLPSTNNGSGAGGATLLGCGIRIEGSAYSVTSDVILGNNRVNVLGSGSACFISANGANVVNVQLNGGDYSVSGSGNALQAAQTGGWNVEYLCVTGAEFNSTSGSADAVSLNAVEFGNFANNSINAGSSRAMYVNGCLYMRIMGGSMTGGSTVFATAGTCTNGYLDKSVNYDYAAGSGSVIANAGTGFNIEHRASAAPTAGTWAVGDHVQNTAPAAGGVPGWYCTTAGTPGTWKAEASVSA